MNGLNKLKLQTIIENIAIESSKRIQSDSESYFLEKDITDAIDVSGLGTEELIEVIWYVKRDLSKYCNIYFS